MTSPECSALLSTCADSVLASSSYIDNSLMTTTTSMTTASVSSPAMTLYKSAVRVCDDGVGGGSSSRCCCYNSAEHVNVCRTCYRSDSRTSARQLQQLQQQAYRDDVVSNNSSCLVPAYNINTVNNNNNNNNNNNSSNSNSSGGSAVVRSTSHVRSNAFDFIHDADLLGALDSIVLTAIDDDDDGDKNSVGDNDEDRAAALSERVVGGRDGVSDTVVASSPSSTRHAMLPSQSLPRQQQQHATARRVQLCTPTSGSGDDGWGRAGDSATTATVVAQRSSAHGDAAARVGDDGGSGDERGHTHVLQTLERLSLLQQRGNDDDAKTTTAATAATAVAAVTRTSQANDGNNVSCSASNVSSQSNAINDVFVNNNSTTTTTVATPGGTLCISDEHVRSNLFICGLAPDVDDATLRDVFGRYGDIESAKVMLNIHTGRSRCIAFVKFTDVQHAATALQELNGATLHDHVMTVRIANSRAAYLPGAPTNKTFVRNVPVTVTRASLQAYFATFGDVVDVSIHADTARLSGVAGASATRTPLAVGMGNNNNKGGSVLVGQGDGGYGVQGVLMPPHALVTTTASSSCSTPVTGNTLVAAATTITATSSSNNSTEAAAAAATAHNIVFVTFTTKEAAARAATATHLAMPFPECCGVPLLAKVAEDSARRVERLTRRYRVSNGNNNSSGGAGGSALFTSSATLPVTAVAAAAAACAGPATMTTTTPAGAFAAVPQLLMNGRLAVPTPPSMSVNSGSVAYAACEPAALLYGTRPATAGMLQLAGGSCVSNNNNNNNGGSVASYHDCMDGAHMCMSGAAGPATTVLHSALPRMVQQPQQQTQQQQQSMQMTPLYMSAAPLQRTSDGVTVTRMPAPVYGVDGRPLTAVYSTGANTTNTHLQLTQAFAPATAAQQQQQQQQLAQLLVSGVVPQSFMLWPSPSTAAPQQPQQPQQQQQQQQHPYAQVGLPGGMRVMYTPLASATPTATFAPAASELSVPYYFVMNTP